MEESGVYKIRPAGRHILTIGRDLIQDQYAAIVELVKNAYDADSPNVEITFEVSLNRQELIITVADHGHGMSRDTVINKWLVPSTDDKLIRRVSPKGRTMQGRKGIGRYAASILGDDLLLESITENGEKTSVYVQWSEFVKAEFLSDVDILVDTSITDEGSGTRLIMRGGNESWDKKQLDKLRFELKKLIPPINLGDQSLAAEDDFSIFLKFVNFWPNQDETISEEIKSYPIFDLYDYKISGTLEENGIGKFVYINQRARNTIEEEIKFNLRTSTACGQLVIDIRVYDRETEAIDQLINRGLKDAQGNYVGKLQARQLLNEYNGIGVYRNGFRIRPLGDPDFDWLKLNEQRIQNPSLKIGSNQVIGYVLIQSEEFSGLREKSARDGLKDNLAYSGLRELTLQVIAELENRRFQYRRKAGLSRTALKVERDLARLFTFDEIKQGVRTKLSKIGVNQKDVEEIIDIIMDKEEETNEIADNLREAVAVYQGQATLGKIINVILHEGRRPLNYFKNQIPNFNFWAEELRTNFSIELLNVINPIVGGMGRNADVFVTLFGRLDPLAAKKRGTKKDFNLHEALTTSFDVFENELIENRITLKIDCPKDFVYFGWAQDFYVILTNLIDNSIFWIKEKKSFERLIEVRVEVSAFELTFIDYRDTGPGIEPHLIESEVIFEPEFSTKPGGTGLGLAIAGEAALRNGLELRAFESNNGAYFRLQPK